MVDPVEVAVEAGRPEAIEPPPRPPPLRDGGPIAPLPPFVAEPNPAGRVIEEVRRAVEGRVDDDLEAKRIASAAILAALAANIARVCRLAGPGCVRDADAARLPPEEGGTADDWHQGEPSASASKR